MSANVSTTRIAETALDGYHGKCAVYPTFALTLSN
jgi:hypothetical protein